MRRPGACALLLGLSSLAAPGGGEAIEKPEVAVSFELADPDLAAEFLAEARGWIEAETALFLEGKLAADLGFLHFSRSAEAPYRLRFRAGRPDADGLLREVRFHVALEGSGIAGPEIDFPFRAPTAWLDGTGGREAFLEEIRGKLSLLDFRDLVPDLLSAIPVARGGTVVGQPLIVEPVAWIIPFRQDELCMDLGSRVRVATALPTNAGPRPRQFVAEAVQPFNPPGQTRLESERHRIICVPAPLQPDFELLSSSDPDQIEVREIYVIEYRRIDTETACAGSIPPEEAFPAGGGS